MCDEQTIKDTEAFLKKEGLSRREFNRNTAAGVAAMMLPAVANALDVVEQDVLVETPDGEADCYFVHPEKGWRNPVIRSWLSIRITAVLKALLCPSAASSATLASVSSSCPMRGACHRKPA